MTRSKALRHIAVLSGIAAAGIIAVALSFPFLAIDAPSGARTAVVEGWIEETYIPEVKALLDEGAYDTIYITGTPRNFSYTLRIGDTVVVELQRPAHGELLVSACGAKDAGLLILGNGGVILADSVTEHCYDRKAAITGPVSRLRVTASYKGRPDPDAELLFILYAKVDGINLHALQRSVTIIRADGSRTPGTPSFADAASTALIAAGTPAERIHPLPTVMLGESRTWANAQRFAKEAKERGIRRADVVSFGVHARRSRLTYGKACGADVTVGVRCIEDPDLQRGRWWRSPTGWYKVVRELAGVPASYLVDPGR